MSNLTRLSVAFCLLHFFAAAVYADPTVETYPLPSIYSPSAAFALEANGRPVPVIGFSKQYDYTGFSFSGGRCELQVTRIDGQPIKHFSISPLKLNLAGRSAGSTLGFTVNNPAYLIVEIDKLPRLVIAVDLPETDKPASSGPGIFNITAPGFSSDATGHLLSTTSIQHAVDDASNQPTHHGIVYVPNGVYVTGPLVLKSNVSLYLEPGAVLRFGGIKEDFPLKFKKDSQHRNGTWFISTEEGATNIKIFGRGTIDADGKQMIKSMNLLSHLLVPIDCSNFTVDGPVLRDSALWGTVIARSNHVTFRNTKHFNFLDMGEDDCIDVCESQDVLLEHTIAISLDDSYSFKSWDAQTDIAKLWPGKAEPLHHVDLEDCFAWSRCFGFKVGAGVKQAEDEIIVHNGVVYDAAHGIGISHSYGGGDVRNMLFDTIDIEHTTCECLGRSWLRIVIDPRKDSEKAGNVFDVQLRNITVRDAGTKPVPIQGLGSENMIHGVTFERIFMPGRSTPATTLEELGIKETKFADGISIRN